MFSDKNKLSDCQNTFLLKKLIVNAIYSASRLENLNTTFPQTQTIIDGMSVNGVSTDDMQVILNLKNAWQWMLANHRSSFNLSISNKINSFVAYNESLLWGELRTGNIFINGVSYEPPIPRLNDVRQRLRQIMNDNTSWTYKALKWMYYAMRSQLYWDGNKRTAIIAANYIMLNHGVGGVMIKENLLNQWNELLNNFYETGDDKAVINWTYQHCLITINI